MPHLKRVMVVHYIKILQDIVGKVQDFLEHWVLKVNHIGYTVNVFMNLLT